MELKKIFKPDSMAVIGVSLSNHFHPASVIYNKNKLRYKTRTYAVNPSGGSIFGDAVYGSVSQLPAGIDLAVIGIRAELVPRTIVECVESGIAGAIIISGGFSETGRHDLQEQVKRTALDCGFPVIGPNCLGVYSSPHVDTFFLPHERLVEPMRGKVSLVSQSGGILVDQMIKLSQEGVGLARAISIGNKAVIDEVDVLRFLIADPETGVIGIYLEGFERKRGRAFIEEVNSSSKPVIVLKSGKTPEGSRAVNSHTASMAGDYFVFSEILSESRAIEAGSEAEFISCCESLSCYRRSTMKGICIITASGGHGALASDGCYSAGLSMAEIPAEDGNALRALLSPSIKEIASVSNPVDLTGSAGDGDFLAAVKYFLLREYVDCLILLLLPYLPGLTPDIGARIAQLVREHRKAVIAYMPHVDKYGIFIEGFERNGIPVAHSVDGAVYMAKSLAGGPR